MRHPSGGRHLGGAVRRSDYPEEVIVTKRPRIRRRAFALKIEAELGLAIALRESDVQDHTNRSD